MKNIIKILAIIILVSFMLFVGYLVGYAAWTVSLESLGKGWYGIVAVVLLLGSIAFLKHEGVIK